MPSRKSPTFHSCILAPNFNESHIVESLLTQLIELHRDFPQLVEWLRNYAIRRWRLRYQDADVIVQEAVIKAEQRSAQSFPTPYMLCILSTCRCDHFRKMNRESEWIDTSTSILELSGIILACHPTSSTDNRDLLDAAIRRLKSRRQRQLVKMVLWGYSVDDMATMLGIKPNSVRKALRRALRQLAIVIRSMETG